MKAMTTARPAAARTSMTPQGFASFGPLVANVLELCSEPDCGNRNLFMRSWIEHRVIEREAIAPYADK